jgi:hypothetical protein
MVGIDQRLCRNKDDVDHQIIIIVQKVWVAEEEGHRKDELHQKTDIQINNNAIEEAVVMGGKMTEPVISTDVIHLAEEKKSVAATNQG